MQWQTDFILEVVANAGYALKTWVNTLVQGPRFLARRAGTTQTVLTGTWTRVNLNLVTFDSFNYWDAGLARFVCARTGFYQVNFSVGYRPALSADKKYMARLVLSGANAAQTINQSSHSDYLNAANAILILLSAGQWLELWCWHNSGGSVNLDYTNQLTYLSIHNLP